MANDDLTKVYYNPYVPPFFVKLTLDNGEVVELEGSGELTQTTVTQYKSTLVSAEIDELCTSIGEFAFQSCSKLTSVTIGNGVTSIGEFAFNSCSKLTSVTISNSVTSIGKQAFNYCTGLTSVTIPSSVTSIGDKIFYNCQGLTNIVIDSANTVYDSRNNCNAIIKTSTNELTAGCKNTVIPNSVTSIGSSAFESCQGLTSITIPDSVTSIGDKIFYGCAGLTSITSLATTAPTIQSKTFNSVKRDGTLYVPSGSAGYDVWMNNYLSSYGWTMVEQ